MKKTINIEILKNGVMFNFDDESSMFVRFIEKSSGINFQHFKNVTTGKVLAIGKTQTDRYSQELADIGFNPILDTHVEDIKEK